MIRLRNSGVMMRFYPLLGALLLCCSAAMAQSQARADEWNYVVAPRDTLIGLVARLMKPPATWQKLQELNRLPNPQQLKPGSIVRLPVAWLKSTARAKSFSR